MRSASGAGGESRARASTLAVKRMLGLSFFEDTEKRAGTKKVVLFFLLRVWFPFLEDTPL